MIQVARSGASTARRATLFASGIGLRAASITGIAWVGANQRMAGLDRLETKGKVQLKREEEYED